MAGAPGAEVEVGCDACQKIDGRSKIPQVSDPTTRQETMTYPEHTAIVEALECLVSHPGGGRAIACPDPDRLTPIIALAVT